MEPRLNANIPTHQMYELIHVFCSLMLNITDMTNRESEKGKEWRDEGREREHASIGKLGGKLGGIESERAHQSIDVKVCVRL